MPAMQLKTVSANQVWSSPDGQRKIYELEMEFEGKPVKAKTYSNAIATVGWEGEAETYEKEGRGGIETFVRQTPKEGNAPGGATSPNHGGNRPAYRPKDEKAIQAMWAIGQAVQLYEKEGKPVKDDPIEYVEVIAQELFAMVDRVKASEDAAEAPKDDKQITIDDIKDTIGGEEIKE